MSGREAATMGIDWKVVAAIVACAFLSNAFAHDVDPEAKKKTTPKAEQKAFGIAGDRKRVTRTVTMEMSDQMRFAPDTLEVKRGETVRFVVRNRGKLMHEMVIGTMDELKEHAALMKKFPEMEHDEPYMAHVQPGKSEEIVWLFNRAGEFNYACLAAGHFEAGMVGKLIVK
jgi:uncharacterized cupredoxin-like copper-binding protein